jgi:tetratricopeptide (TPR) repeat protein
VTGSAQRSALDAISSARPIVARLSISRDKEDLAADIIDAWSIVETGLRSLIGGSTLGGQPLIRELRQRNFLAFDQANALAEFHAARERAGRVEYAPTESDVNVVRDAFIKLESGLMTGPEPTRPGVIPPGSRSSTMSDLSQKPVGMGISTGTPIAPVATAPARPARPAWLVPVLGAAGIVVIVGIVWLLIASRGGSSAAYNEGVMAYKEGRHEAALGAFHKAALEAPADPMPHVFLARIEREQGNLTNANTEAVDAVRLGPNSGAALRELASTAFAQQNFDVARTFYIRAIRADSTDHLSEGYLGCALIKLGRTDDGTRWLQRAGNGDWTKCAPAPAVPASPVPMTR